VIGHPPPCPDPYHQTRLAYVSALIRLLGPGMPKKRRVALMDRIERHLAALQQAEMAQSAALAGPDTRPRPREETADDRA
jgi:hypothetical protein